MAADGHDHGFLEAVVSWDPKVIPITGKKLTEMLKGGEPRLVYYPEYGDEHSGVLQTRSMKQGEVMIAARRLRHVFLVEAKAKAKALPRRHVPVLRNPGRFDADSASFGTSRAHKEGEGVQRCPAQRFSSLQPSSS